jgi:hypothetical protein
MFSLTVTMPKFAWASILGENLKKLVENSFAAQYYLKKQVIPAILHDLEILHSQTMTMVAEKDNGESQCIQNWINDYKEVGFYILILHSINMF